MSVDETPIDCFRVLYKITGSKDEIEEEKKNYIAKYPYMSYGTQVSEVTDEGVVMIRFRTVEICIKACTHKPKQNPVGEAPEPEKGKDHTVFQTT